MIIIRTYASGDKTMREKAIDIHRKYLATTAYRDTTYYKFMHEIDNPSPDLALRNKYRRKILNGVFYD